MDDANSSARKRARTISDLTEEQIQQKRQVDRKAQQAFRQRTRDRMSRLELHIVELQESSSQRESQLQQELVTLREQNKTLTRRLERISYLATTASPRIDDAGLDEHHRNQDSAPQPELGQSLRNVFATADSPSAPFTAEHESHRRGPQIATSNELHSTPVQTDVSISISQPETSYNAPRPYATDAPDTAYIASDVSNRENGRIDSLQGHSPPETTADAVDLPPANPETHLVSQAVPRPDPLSALLISSDTFKIDTSYYTGTRSVFAVLPAHVAPTCPLDRILIGFFISRRQLLSEGVPLESVIGPQKASMKGLVHPELSPFVHPLSKVMSEVMSTYHEVGKPEQIALVYLMHQTMRWQISPSKENYFCLPTWLRPTVTQITVPHAAWIDNVPWPGVRDLLVENPEVYPYKLWTENFTQNVSVNWEFDTSDALSESNDEIVLHSIFEKHIRKLKNWTVLPEFAQLLPNLMPAIYSCD